jgi:hypothetical protein
VWLLNIQDTHSHLPAMLKKNCGEMAVDNILATVWKIKKDLNFR